MARTREVEMLDVKGLSLDAIREQLDLRDPIKVPVSYMDPTTNEWRQMPDAAIMLSGVDNRPISKVVSADYKPHSWASMLELMEQYAKESRLHLARIGMSRGVLLAKYEQPGVVTLPKVGDTINAGITMAVSNDGTSALQMRSWLYRLICGNGARAFTDQAEFRITHDHALSTKVLEQAHKAIEQLTATIGAHDELLSRWSQVTISPELARAFLRILAYPATQVRADAKLRSGETLTYRALEPIIRELAVPTAVIQWGDSADGPFKPNTAYRAMVDSWQSAPGADTKSLAGVFHAVTHYRSQGMGGTRSAREWGVLQDTGASAIRTTYELLDSYAAGVAA